MSDIKRTTKDGKCVVIYHQMTPEEEQREIARLREKAILDEKSAMSYAKREGLAEGEAKGRAKGEAEGRTKERAEILARMREDGLTEEQIRKYIK